MMCVLRTNDACQHIALKSTVYFLHSQNWVHILLEQIW